MLTQDYICSYLVPLCGDELAYIKLPIKDYIEHVLTDKPEVAQNDNYLDSLYELLEY